MPERFGSNESTYDSLRSGTVARAIINYSHDHDNLYLRLDTTNDPLTGPLDIETFDDHALRVLTPPVISPFPTTPILDDFNRPDEGPPPSASWTSADMYVASSRLSPTPDGDGNTFGFASWNAIPATADQEMYVTLYVDQTLAEAACVGITSIFFFGVRRDMPTHSGYAAHVAIVPPLFANPGSFQLDIYRDGVAISGFIIGEYASGDAFGISAIGNVITAYHKPFAGAWEVVIAATDNTIVNPGVAFVSVDACSPDSSADSAWTLDDFGGGESNPGIPSHTCFNVDSNLCDTTVFHLTVEEPDGTPPLTVASTTLVTNLNADLLDGLHASAFPAVGPASAEFQYIVSGASPTYTPAWSSGFLNIASGKTLAATGTLTLTPSSDGLTLTVPTTGTAVLGTGAHNFIGLWSDANNISYNGALYFDSNILTLNTSSAASVGLDLRNTNTGAGATATFAFTADTVQLQAFVANVASGAPRCTIISTNGYLRLGTVSADNVYLGSNDGFAVTIDTGQNVGLSTFSPACRLHVNLDDAITNAITEMVRFSHNSSGTPSNGFGVRQLFTLESSTTADQSAAALDVLWTDATHASRASSVKLSAYYTTTAREALTISADSVASVTTIANAQAGTYTTTAVDLTLTTAHHWVTVTATGKTITLPAASTCTGREYIISATAANVIVDGNGSETINGYTTYTMSADSTMQIKSDGSGWIII